jgi:outer membrane murein-binding lipoprotein Lpp
MKMQSLLIVLGVACFVVVGVALAGGSESKKDLASEVETLKTQVAALQKQAQASQDYIAISNLQTAYGYYVDKCKWDEAADLFAKDSTLEIGLRGVYVGQDRVRAYLHKLPDLKYGTLFNHTQLQPKIDVAPDGLTAKGRWRAIMQVGILHKSAQWGEATYENEYVKEDGIWKIKKLHAYFTYYSNYYKGWDQGGDPPPGPIPGFPPDRPPTEVYKLYPDVYVPPYHYKNPVTGK